MRRISTFFAGACVALLLSRPSAAADAAAPGPAKKTPVPFATVAALLNTAFEGTTIHLNNYRASGFRAGDAFVQLGARLGGGRVPVALPVQVASLPYPVGEVRLFVNDVNSSRLAVDFSGGIFVATIDFESDGTELIVRSDSAMPLPDVEVDSGNLTVSLRPGPDASGRPSFASLTAAFSAQYRCSAMGAFCDGLLDFVKPSVDALIQEAARKSIDTPEMRDRVGQALVAVLRSDAGRAAVEAATHEKIGAFRGAHYEGNALIVEHD